MPEPTPPAELPIGRGLRGLCPRCGQGRLFQGFLTLRPACEQCGLDYDFADAIRKYSITQDITAFDNLHCDCRLLWEKVLELEDRTFGAPLIY